MTEEAGVDWTTWITSQVSFPCTCVFWGCWPFLPVPDGFLSVRAWACRGWAGQGRRVSKLQLRLGEHHTRGCEPHVCCMCLHVLCTSVHMSACAAFVCASRVCACAVHVPACAACHSVLCICVLHVCMCCACVCMYAACLSVLHVCACGMQVCVLHTSVHVLGTCLCSGGQTHAHTLLLHIFSDITLLPWIVECSTFIISKSHFDFYFLNKHVLALQRGSVCTECTASRAVTCAWDQGAWGAKQRGLGAHAAGGAWGQISWGWWALSARQGWRRLQKGSVRDQHQAAGGTESRLFKSSQESCWEDWARSPHLENLKGSRKHGGGVDDTRAEVHGFYGGRGRMLRSGDGFHKWSQQYCLLCSSRTPLLSHWEESLLHLHLKLDAFLATLWQNMAEQHDLLGYKRWRGFCLVL